MIKYFNELDNRNNYYLPLVARDNGKKSVDDYHIPISFVEKYNNVFKTSESLISIYRNFDIEKWFDENKIFDYENACSIWEEYNDIEEEMYWTLEEYKKIDVQSRDIEFYVDLVERLSFLFIDLFPKNKECYEKLNIVLKQAKNDLKEISTITYSPSKVDNIYLPDAWYITPNGYLYNPGKDGHAGSDLTFTYQELKRSIINNKDFSNNKNKISIEFKKMADDILMKEYISAGQFKFFINYISQPAYLDSVNGIPITREKHIVNIVVGIIMAHAYFYEFFDNFFNYVKNPQIELNKIVELTNDEISDILVRCCGFHKVESMVENTITTSCINYEEEFRHYIEKGWTIQFIPPIIINKEKECVEEYSDKHLLIKKMHCNK